MAKRVNQRRIYFIDKGFQSRFMIKFCLLVILGSIITAVFLYLFSARSTTVSFEDTRAVVKTTADFLFPLLIQMIIVSSVFVGIATIILTLFISHRIAGPLYRFKKVLSTVESGDLSHDFHIRKNDQLQDIALSMNGAIKKLRENLSELKREYSVLKNFWEESLGKTISRDEKIVEDMKEKMGELKKKLDYFKT